MLCIVCDGLSGVSLYESYLHVTIQICAPEVDVNNYVNTPN